MSFVLRFIPAIILASRICAMPLSFEERTAVLFEARLDGELATFRTDRFSIGPLTVHFPGSSPHSTLEGIGTSAPSTYLRAGSRNTFSQFPKLALRGLYPGVDAIFYGCEATLEYDLILAPHADTRHLRLRFEGTRRLWIDQHGDLRVEDDSGVLIQKRPRVFQFDRHEISVRYVLLSRNEVGFRLGPYDARQTLKIDPELEYLRTFGGSGSDTAAAVTTDAQGNIYVAGTTNSLDFPATAGLSSKPSYPLASVSSADLTVHTLPLSTEGSVTAFAGTSDGRILYAATLDGIYESGDAGATWMPRGRLTSPVASLTVDAIDPSKVLAATSQGLFFSSDSGQSWFLHEFGLAANVNGGVVVTSTIISPLDQTIVYAITGSPNGLFKSTDLGGTWHQLNLTYPGEAPAQGFSYAIAATLGPNGSDLYVVDGVGNLLKSVDGGTSFQLLGAVGQNLFVPSTILVDSTASTFYILGTVGVYKSIDGGHTFNLLPGLTPLVTSSQLKQIALDTASNTLYLGTSAMLYASTDGGATFNPLIATPNLHSLAVLGGTAYAGFDTPAVPYVIKWDPTGTQILYSTFLGGASTSFISTAKVDSQGHLMLAGTTYSPDFPVTSTLANRSPFGYPNVFVTALTADGTQVVYSAIIGDPKGLFPTGLATDSSGAAYVTGQTGSPDFPTTPNSFQSTLPTTPCSRPQGNPFAITNTGANAFVTKLGPDGSLVYSTFLTGSCGSAGEGIAVNAAGEAVIVGLTTSPDFPVSPNTYQPAFPGDPSKTSAPNALYAGFVTRLSAAGDKVIASSYLGGGFATSANAVTVDAAGNITVTGYTSNLTPGATPGAFQPKALDDCAPTINIGPGPPPSPSTDAFVLKLDPALGTPRYMTYLGGSCNDSGTGIALDSSGNAWVTGNTQSSDFPLRSPYQARGITGRFVSELSADGTQLLYSSGTDGLSLTLDSSGAVYLAGTQGAPGLRTKAELIRINPASVPPVVIDAINPVTAYPPAVVIPSSFGAGLAPGELVRITGHNLGPATLVNAQLDAFGRLPFSLANSTVYFDHIPAPLISVQDTAIECFAPFEINSTTKISVEYNSAQSNTVLTGVIASDLQILSITNEDGSPNSAAHPASPGSEVVFYVSGLGETTPLSVDGLVNSPPVTVPIASVAIYLSNVMVKPQFVGSAPGMIAGISQVNVRLPSTAFQSNTLSIGLNNVTATIYVAH
jgi:uncharacterized protein (TIGR03437 family)